jgi:hypothetical protein
MLTFREGWRSFKEGLDRRFIWEYWLAVKNHSWEIFWGAGVIGIICTIFTLYYSPSRNLLGWVVAWLFLVAGYFVWRADHIRLIPKLKIAGTGFQDTPVVRDGRVVDHRTFVQLLPECLTESPVYECVGYLQRIERRGGQNQWEEIALDRNLRLGWSEENLELHPRAEKPLNVFFLPHNTNQIIPTVRQDADIPFQRFDALLMQESVLRFHVQITCSDRVNGNFVSIQPVKVCLEVRFEGPNRFRPILELTQQR